MRCLTHTLHVNCSLYTVLGGYCLFWSYPPVYLHVYQSVSLNCYFPLHCDIEACISPVSREVIDSNWGQICCDRAHVPGHVTAGHSSCSWSGRCCSSCSCTADRCLQLHASISHSSLHADWNFVLYSDNMWIFLYLTLSSSALHPLCSLLCLQSVSPSSPPPSPGHIQPLHHSSPLTLPPRSCSANQNHENFKQQWMRS